MPQQSLSLRKNFLERQADGLVSIGNDAPTLLAFKAHCGLPTMAEWTEADYLLKSNLAAAERTIDELCGVPYRLRSYKFTLDRIERNLPSQFYGIRLPCYPVNSGITIDWRADDLSSGSYVQNTDFSLFGAKTHSPEIIFPLSLVLPTTAQTAYPFVVNFTAGPGEMKEIAMIAMFELAAYYYRCPEAISDKNPNAGSIYQAHLDLLANNFL